ncbi:MAG: LOG family protein, partial [Bacteroidota bacterium]
MERIVTVFGSSRPRQGDPEYILAYDVGKELAKAGFTVCNGGYGGIMEASARGAKNAGGKTIGIITDIFPRKANDWIDTTHTAKTLIDRMMELISRGDAYVVLKGGTGTLLELAAVWEFMNKNIMRHKPIVVVGDFWDGVVNTLKEELAWEGLEDCTRFVTVVDSPVECVTTIKEKL